MEQSYSKKCRYSVLLIICIAWMVIFNRSLVFVSSEMSTHKLIVIALNVFVIVVFPALMTFLPVLSSITDRFLRWLTGILRAIKRNWKHLLIYLGAAIIAWGLSWLFEYAIICHILQEAANDSRRVLIFAILLLGITIYAFRRRAGRKPEQFFAVVAFILGVMLIRVSPATLGVMVDDETHYARVLAEANLFDGSRLDVENKLLAEFTESVFNKLAYDRESRDAYYAELNAMYEQKNVVSPNVRLHGIWSLSYVPSAIGMIVGQGLSLSYVHVVMCGKLFNLLFYIAIFYWAIRKISYGKVLVATIGMIPTCIYMASNYSYDPWLIGFTVLSYAYFFYEIQNPEKKLETKSVVCMLLFLLLGCMPKAVYCVLGLPFLFMPKDKFKDKKQRLWYYMPVIVAGVALVGTFLVPALMHGVGEGDLRGGDGINANAQLSYILSHPVQYMKVLKNFLMNYLSVNMTQSYLQNYFYFGNGKFVGLTSSILLIVAFLDKRNEKGMTLPIRISGVAASLLAAVTCATVMYIVFTPVASEQIFGCQGRYLLPAVFPFLMSISPDKIENRINPHAFVMVPLLLLATTFMYNVYTMCIALY